jgi:hypothetical protein
MATRKVQLVGIAEWAKVFASNRDMYGYKPTPAAEGNYEKFNGACTLNIILDGPNLEALQSSGAQTPTKKDAEGRGTVVKFDRKFDTGQAYSSGAPVVTHADGTPWDMDVDGLIGNGSTVEIVATVYDIPKYGKVGTRLDSVKVLDHVSSPVDDVEVFSASSKPAAVSSPASVQQTEDEVMF